MLSIVIESYDWKAERISSFKMACVEGFLRRRYVAPLSKVAVVSLPAAMNSRQFELISSCYMDMTLPSFSLVPLFANI